MTDLGFIHRFIPPANGSDTSVALLLLHGTGGNEDDLVPLGAELLPGAALLSPRGKVMEHGMPRFFRRLAEGVFDLDDLKARTDELAGFLGRAKDHYHLHGRMIAVGYSNGANIAASLMLLHPTLLAGAVLLRPMVPFAPENPPLLSSVNVLIASGTLDPVVPREQPEELAEMLKRCGAAVTLIWHESGHELGKDDIVDAVEWLQDLSLA